MDEPDQIANELNNYFASVFTVEQDSVPIIQDKTAIMLEHLQFNTQDVFDKLKALDKKRSVGPDDVHPHVLAECAKAFAIPLQIIYNKSLSTSRVPDNWREANVTPIFKKGDKQKAENYRPISLTSIPCKVLERLVAERIIKHMNENKLLSPQQHGFIKGKSCTTNLLEYMDMLTTGISNGKYFDVIYTDFAKAFDKVPHKRLLAKLSSYGIKKSLLEWINSFLTGRKQRVIFGSYKSLWKWITSGVPQGSVLGPLLFLLYINDLPDYVQNPCKLYADDGKVISEVCPTTKSSSLQQDIDNLSVWSNTWKIALNTEKCKIMHIGAINPGNKYTMMKEGTRVELASSTVEKDIGIYISNDLNWATQVKSAAAKANSMLGIINKTFKHKDKHNMRALYCAYVRPHMETSIQAWCPYWRKDIDALERVQKRATKLVPELRHLPYAERLKRMNLTTLEIRRLRGDLIQQFKIHHGYEKINWHMEQKPVSSICASGPAANTRANTNNKYRIIRQSIAKCKQREHFFTNRVSYAWNMLSNSIIESTSINQFKAKLDKLNLEEYQLD